MVKSVRTNSIKKKNRKENKVKKAKVTSMGKTGIMKTLFESKEYYSGIQSSYRKKLSGSLQKMLMISEELEKDKKKRTEFYADEFWSKSKKLPDPNDTSKVLSNVLLFVCGRGRNESKTISFYKRVLDILKSDGVKTHQIAEEIVERGGLRAILDAKMEKNCNLEKTDESYKPDKNTPSKASSNTTSSREAIISVMKDNLGGIYIEAEEEEVLQILKAKEDSIINLKIHVYGKEKNEFLNFELIEYNF